jgi:hypothetical protein
VLAAALERAGLAERLRQERAVALWATVAGPELARRTRAVAVREGVLWVAVRNAAWAGQLAFLRSTLVERLQAAGATVQGVHFSVGAPGADDGSDEDDPAAPAAPPALTAAEEAAIVRLCAPVTDTALAAAWRRVVRAGWRRSRRWRRAGGPAPGEGEI